jgi:hypothetical protein
MTVLPDQILDAWEVRWSAFDNRNGLVKDPEYEVRDCCDHATVGRATIACNNQQSMHATIMIATTACIDALPAA